MPASLRKFVLACLAVAGLAACTPESIRPLPEELRVPADDRLIGTWRAQVLGNEHVATVTRGGGDVLVVALRSATVPPGDVAPVQSRHELRFYDIDGTRVISEHGPGLVGGRVYRYAAYDVGDDGTVTLRFASAREFGKFILPLKLAAEIRARGPVFRDFLLTAHSENIAHVLRTVPPAAMFDVPFGPFVRQ